MAKYTSNFSGQEIDQGIAKAFEDVGDAYFDPTTNRQYLFKTTEDKMAWIGGDTSVEVKICPFEFSGTVNRMTVINFMDSKNLFYTQMSESATITVGFKSEEKGITDTSWQEVNEDARITVEIDRGVTGKYTTIVNEQLVLNGNTLSFDVFKYLATGNNRVRVTAIGVDTGTSSNIIYSVLLTSMYIAPANFEWNKPFIEGSEYKLGGLYIGGSIDKILKIKVSNEQAYSKLYEINIGTQTNTSIAYYYNGLEFPTEGTGVYNVEMWLDANGLESEHLHYNIMCVAATDIRTAKLIAVSNVLPIVKNYDTNKLFSYAVYNGGATTANPIVNVYAIINNTPTSIVPNETLVGVTSGVINDYTIDLGIETQENNIQLYSSIELGDSKQEAVYAIDNSASFPAVAGAVFYMNPANRNNAQDNKTTIVNESKVAKVPTEYMATWESVSFTDGMDGWTEDNYGRKCLRLPAGSFIEVDYAPLANATTRTIEFYYRAENTADYNEDIISIASALTSNFVGARIKPTNVLLHSEQLHTDDLMQGYNTKDEELVHLIITVIQGYKEIGNLAQIYVNGVKKCSFEWSVGDTFAHNGKLLFGSNTSDLYIYKTRVYTDAFDWIMAAQNFISCLPDIASKKAAHAKMQSVLNDSNQIDFDKVKSGGFNYFVLRLPDGAKLPSILNQSSVKHTRLEINIQQNPLFAINGIYEDEETEGQGTTAMDYFRWNLRWKTEIIRITAKKNVASSMHSHKMGATALFNDLNRMIVGANEADARVAVEQYGAYGFLEELKEGTTDQYTYVPIGLYTIGQDKGDKTTFGYNNPVYKDTLIHMEGSDHKPKAIGMDYPWSKLSVYTNSEGDSFLGVKKEDGSAEKAWEIGACGSAKNDADMLAYLTQEFYPAYDCDYRNTSMIVGVEKGTDIYSASFRAIPTSNGFKNADCLVWIDGEYETYYYDEIQKTYLKDGLNILKDLEISESDLKGTTASEKNQEIIELRKSRYRAEMENYWHLRDNLFHYCFVVLFAATDNFKKNTYPYKFGTLTSGSRWRWRQDDLDTLADINNQGLATKIYSILNGDKSLDNQLFNGNTSYHWTNIRFYYENEIKSMMLEILTAMASLSDTGDSLIEKALGCVRKYFWNKAQDYFTKSAYNLDAEWTYEEAWAAMKNGTYDATVHPLQQSLGSHYEAERAWFELRFIFMASLYGFGAFGIGNGKDTSLGQISFRLGKGTSPFEFTPAIDMNPTILIGDSNSINAERRVKQNEKVSLPITTTESDTSIYIQGADYLSDIGDFSKVNLYPDNPVLTIQCKRLQKLKVGDENAENVTTVLKTLNVLSCPSLSEVDARNVSTLTGTVDLSKCPRLKKALFGGSSAGEIALPRGSKITEFELPDSITNLSLVNLPNLEYSSTTGESGVLSDYETGKYYATNQGVGNVCTLAQTTDANFVCKRFDCSNIISITITGRGGNTPRLWCFLDAENKIISVAAEGAQVTDLVVSVPDGAKTAIVNFNKNVVANYSVVVTAKALDGGLKIGDLTALSYLRVENNPNIQGFALLKATFEDGAPLTNIRVIGFDYDGDSIDIQLLAKLASGGYFGINEDGSRNPNIIPVIEGTLNVAGSIYEDDAKVIEEKYGAGLILNVTGGYYICFEDPEFQKLVADKYGDGVGITQEQADAVTSINLQNNTTVSYLNDLYKFSNLNSMNVSNSNIAEINIPISAGWNIHNSIRNVPNLEKLIISSEKITVIGQWAITGNKKLFDLVIPNSVTTIGAQALFDVPLKRMVFGTSLVSCGTDSATFRGHTNESIYIDSLKHWFEIAFSQTPLLTSSTLYLGQIEAVRDPNKGNQIDHYLWDKLEGTGDYVGQGTRVKVTTEMVNKTLKEVTEIKSHACRSMTQLEGELVIPSNIKTIGNYAFDGCTGLTSLVIEEGVETIGEYSLRCNGLSGDLVIPDSVTMINKSAIVSAYKTTGTDRLFINLSNKPSLTTDTHTYSPINNTGFKEIYIDNVQALVESEVAWFSNTVNVSKYIWDLYVNDVLTKDIVLDCPETHTTMTSILSGSSITSIKLNEGFITVNAFDYCTSLAFIDLPSTITDIKGFLRHTKGTLICRAVEPPTLQSSLLMLQTAIYVPDESVEAYKAATNWSSFATKIKPFYEVEELPTTAEDGALYIIGDTYNKAVVTNGVLTWETI